MREVCKGVREMLVWVCGVCEREVCVCVTMGMCVIDVREVRMHEKSVRKYERGVRMHEESVRTYERDVRMCV